MSTPKSDVDAWAATLDQGHPVSFAFSRGKSLLLIVVWLFLALIGLVMAVSDGALITIVGALLVVGSLIGVVAQIRKLFARASALVVSPEGISMKTARAGVIPWAEIIDVRPVKQNSNVFIELAVTEEEGVRQAEASPMVSERELDNGVSQKVLWLPVGIAAKKPALCHWLHQEHHARTTV